MVKDPKPVLIGQILEGAFLEIAALVRSMPKDRPSPIDIIGLGTFSVSAHSRDPDPPRSMITKTSLRMVGPLVTCAYPATDS